MLPGCSSDDSRWHFSNVTSPFALPTIMHNFYSLYKSTLWAGDKLFIPTHVCYSFRSHPSVLARDLKNGHEIQRCENSHLIQKRRFNLSLLFQPLKQPENWLTLQCVWKLREAVLAQGGKGALEYGFSATDSCLHLAEIQTQHCW